MTDFKSSVPQKPAPSRRRYARAIILCACPAFTLIVFVCCYAVTVAVAAVSNGLDAVFHAVFAGLGEAVASIVIAMVLSVLVIFPWLMELASLFSTGQLIPFVMRLLQLLGSS